MDLISRDKAQEIIPKVVLGASDFAECIRDSVDTVFDNCPSAFEGKTNGEILEALFSTEGIYKDVDFIEFIFKGETHTTYFTRDFWDSPYQKGGE